MRKQSRSVYYVRGTDQEGFTIGWNCLLQSLAPTSTQNLWILTPANFSLRGIVQDVLGEQAVTALLLNNDTATIGGQIPIKHFTENTLPYIASYAALLLVSPTRKVLERVDALNGVVSVTALVENTETLRDWIEKWQASEAVAEP